MKFLWRIAHIRFLLILMLCLLSGCETAGTSTSNEPVKDHNGVFRIDAVEPSEEDLVTIEPRRFLDKLELYIGEIDSEIEIVDSLRFRDEAFPEGGWLLKDLLDKENCNRVYESLSVDYLILLESIDRSTSEEHGFHLPPLYIVGSVDEKLTASAIVIDIHSASQLCKVSSEAQGHFVVYQYVIFMGAYFPRLLMPSLKGLAEGIVKLIREKRGSHVRIAVLAAEPRMY